MQSLSAQTRPGYLADGLIEALGNILIGQVGTQTNTSQGSHMLLTITVDGISPPLPPPKFFFHQCDLGVGAESGLELFVNCTIFCSIL